MSACKCIIRSVGVMRDGIYKSLPLGRSWQSFAKSCERGSERGDRATAKAERAVVLQLRNELGGSFLSNLRKHVDRGAAMLPGFQERIDDGLSCRDLGGTNSPLENDILVRAKRLQWEGVTGRSVAEKALKEAIEELKTRQSWQIEQHYILQAGAAAKPVIHAAREALNGVDSKSIAESIINDGLPKTPKVKNQPIDPDENLRKSR